MVVVCCRLSAAELCDGGWMPIRVVDVPNGRWFGGLENGETLLGHEHGGLEPVCTWSARSMCCGECAVCVCRREANLVHGVLGVADDMAQELKLHGRKRLREGGDRRGELGCFLGNLLVIVEKMNLAAYAEGRRRIARKALKWKASKRLSWVGV